MANSKDKKQIAVNNGFVSFHGRHEITGPLPSAEELLRYKDVIPDLPERIVKQFEEDSEHARAQQTKALDANISFDTRSQNRATAIILAGYAITGVLAYFDANAAVFVSAPGSTAMIFKGTFSRRK